MKYLILGSATQVEQESAYTILRRLSKMKGTICAENATPSGAKFIIEMP